MISRHLKLLRLISGQTVRELHEQTGIPVRTLEYRLKQLIEADYLDKRRSGRNILYFKTQKGEEAARRRLDTVMVSSGRASWKCESRIDATSCNNSSGLVETLSDCNDSKTQLPTQLPALVKQDVAPIASVQDVAPIPQQNVASIPTLTPEEEEELENRERAALGLPPRSDSFYTNLPR